MNITKYGVTIEANTMEELEMATAFLDKKYGSTVSTSSVKTPAEKSVYKNHNTLVISSNSVQLEKLTNLTGLDTIKENGDVSHYQYSLIVKTFSGAIKLFADLDTKLSDVDNKDVNKRIYIYNFKTGMKDAFIKLWNTYINEHVHFSDDINVKKVNNEIESVSTPSKSVSNKDEAYAKKCANLIKAREAKKAGKRKVSLSNK